jgi:hypothetical protein
MITVIGVMVFAAAAASKAISITPLILKKQHGAKKVLIQLCFVQYVPTLPCPSSLSL